MATFFASVIVAAWEVFAVPKAVFHLLRDRASRNWWNLSAVAVAAFFLAATVYCYTIIFHIRW